MYKLSLIALIMPLIVGLLAGFIGSRINKSFTHWITTLGILISFFISCWILKEVFLHPGLLLNQNIYEWMSIAGFNFKAGILVDHLTASMMVVVTFISLMVHIYSIGYMRDDPGYHRFFCYI